MPDSAQYVSEMDLSLPLAGASAGEGDDEIRAAKRAVKQTLVGSGPSENWAAKPDWNRAVADPYDTPVQLGPRAMNALPKAIDTISAAITALDARIDVVEAGVATSAPVPVGAIMLWSGAVNTIPANWKLCDGTQGTPDLRDRFVVAAGASYAVGATNTPATYTELGGDHTHGGATQSHTLTVAQIPAHGHPYAASEIDANSAQSDPAGGAVLNANTVTVRGPHTGTASASQGQMIGGAGGGEGHTHGIAASGTHSHLVDVRPAYYALAYIQYLGAPPLLASPIPDQALEVGEATTLNISVYFYGATSYTATPLPSGVSFNGVTGAFSGTATTVQTVTTTVTAINSRGQVTDTFNWDITA